MIWFDIAQPKFVLFFCPIIKALQNQSVDVLVTSRTSDGYVEVDELLNLYNIEHINVGSFGGSTLEGKYKARLDREAKLLEIVLQHKPRVLVTGSETDANSVAFGLGIPIMNVNDMPVRSYEDNYYDTHPAVKLTLPLSRYVFKPFVVPDEIYLNNGLSQEQILSYNFIDPYIWLKDYQYDKDYIKTKIPSIDYSKPIVVIREEEFKASYVNTKNMFLYDVIKELQEWDINCIIIPRYEATNLKKMFTKSIILEEKIILQHLLYVSNLFIGGGGTINIEATYFGVPVISTRSFISHYDKFSIDNGLMYYSNDTSEIIKLSQELINTNTKEIADNLYSQMEMDINFFVNHIVRVANGK